jgi:ankyrin repeat protein
MSDNQALKQILAAGGAAAAELLDAHPELAAAAGEWWAPGFGARKVRPEIARLLVDRGAPLTIHAAAGLGLLDRVEQMVGADPTLVHAKGGDGCTPLHFARDTSIARFLLDRGALVNAHDEDHDSTPIQWLIGDAPDVVRFLLDRGAVPDIFCAAALGDLPLARKLVAGNPGCTASRIGRPPDFPPLGHKNRGGTIYQWTLAFNSYPHQIALLKGHREMFEFLYEHSDTRTRFLVDCVLARRSEAEAIAAANPDLIAALPAGDLEIVAKYCWETNTNYEAVKLMLDLGFPVAHPERSHGYSPLHNAAWAGSGDLVDLLISRGAPVDLVDPTYHATPLGFALYDCLVEKRHPEGEFPRVVTSLLKAGSPLSGVDYPTGHAGIDKVLAPYASRIAASPDDPQSPSPNA